MSKTLLWALLSLLVYDPVHAMAWMLPAVSGGASSGAAAVSYDLNATFTQEALGTKSADLDGTEDAIQVDGLVTSLASLTTGTIEGWIFLDADDGALNQIFSISHDGGATATELSIFADFRLSYKYFHIFLQVDGTTQWQAFTATDSTDAFVGKWVHVALTHNGTAAAFFLNGVSQSLTWNVSTDKTQFFKGLLTDATNDADAANFGYRERNGADAYWFDGHLDEWRIWNDARTAAEIAAQAENPAGTPDDTTGLIHSWDFDDNLTDGTGSADGTAVGTWSYAADYPGLSTSSIALVDTQVLDSSFWGVDTGSLTITDTSAGTVAIGGNDLDVTWSGSYDAEGAASAAITRELGKAFIFTITPSTNNNSRRVGWLDSSTIDSTAAEANLFFEDSPAGQLEAVDVGGENPTIGTYSAAATQYAIVHGPYKDDASGVPWDGSAAASSYEDGAAFFENVGGTTWTLKWLMKTGSSATLYAGFVGASSVTDNFDNLRIPTSTLESALQPIALDLGTGTNGNTLESGGTHDADVYPSGETTWHKRTDECAGGVGDSSWTIDTNTIELSTAGTNCTYNATQRWVYVDTGQSDFIVDATVLCDTGNTDRNGLYYRGAAETGSGANYWRSELVGDGTNCDTYTVKVVDGSGTTVSSDTAGSYVDGTAYDLRVIADTQAHDFYIDGASELSASSQADHQTETRAGLYSKSTTLDDKAFDNFAVYGRTTSGSDTYDNIFSDYE